MIRISHLIAAVFKRRNPLHKRKESSFAKQTTRKLRLDSLESRNLLSCAGFADPGVLAESLDSSIAECRAAEVVANARDADVIYFDLDDAPFYGPLPKEAHEAYRRRIQSGNAVSAAESEAIFETHSHDNTLEPAERVKPLAASQASIKQYNFDAETLDVGGTTYSSGSGGSGSDSGGGGSSGGSTSGGSTSSGGTHEYCSHKPWLCGGLGSSSSGGASGGNSKPGFYLITDDSDEIVLVLNAGDEDENSERNENLQLVPSSLPIKDQSLTKIGNTYVFTVKLDVSSYGTINGSFKVVDCDGRESPSVDVCVRPVKITGFEIQEKAPGAETFTSLEDDHVVWRENLNRVGFNVLGDIDGDDPDDCAAFMSLFTYQVKGQAWTWDSTENDYVRSNTWNSFNGLNGGLGVYNLEIDLYANNQKFKSLPDNARYCFNAVSSVAWENSQESLTPEETSSHLNLISDGSNGVKAFVEQPLNTSTGALNPEKNIATARVTLAVQLPVGMTATVYVDWFDPDNPIGSTITASGYGKGKRDNHGTISQISSNVLTFNVVTGRRSGFVTLTINGGYAGDNYILAAHPNFGVMERAEVRNNNVVVPVTDNNASGGSSSSGGSSGGDDAYAAFLDKTSMLTVWRSLWVERDRMTFTFPTENVQTAASVLIDGIVETQLARACVDVKEYSPNNFVLVQGVEKDDPQAYWGNYLTYRDCPVSSNSFWAIYSIGAFNTVRGACATRGGNTLVAYNWNIAAELAKWNDKHPNSTISVASLLYRRITLHELGHFLGLQDGSTGVMWSEEKEEDEDLNLQALIDSENIVFTIDNLKTIQSQSMPIVVQGFEDYLLRHKN